MTHKRAASQHAVIYEGEIVGILETAKTNEQEIGLLMAGAGRERGEQ